jgi:hypothetical protein
MIGIPEFTLDLAPHTVNDNTLKQAAAPNDEPLISYIADYLGLSTGIISGIGIIGIILWRRRNSTENE